MNTVINTYLPIVASTAAVYLFIVIALRIFGKSEVAQLSVTDLVFIMLLSNAVQNAMVGPNVTLLGGLAAAATLFIINAIFKALLYRFPKLGKALEGESLMLIYCGKVNDSNLKKAKISVNELLEAVREHGVEKISDVDLAVLEVDGNISVLSGDFSRKTTHSVKRRIPKKGTKKAE